MKVLSMYCLEQGLNPAYRYLEPGNVLRCSSRSLAILMCAGLALDLEHDVNLSSAAALKKKKEWWRWSGETGDQKLNTKLTRWWRFSAGGVPVVQKMSTVRTKFENVPARSSSLTVVIHRVWITISGTNITSITRNEDSVTRGFTIIIKY